MRTGSIYIIKNTENDKVYVGQTTMTVHERFMTHMKPSNVKQKSNYKIYNAVKKYGRDKFYVETLEDNVPLNIIDDREISWIAKFDSFNHGYNSTPGGDGRIISVVDDEEKLLSMAKSGMNSNDIAAELGINNMTVLRSLHRLGFRYHVDRDMVKADLLSGTPEKDIAKKYGINPQTVSRIAKHLGLQRKKASSEFDIDTFKKMYYGQMPIKDICKALGVSESVLGRTRRAIGMKTRPQIYAHKTRTMA